MGKLKGPIVVVDVETTGLFPFRHDRIVEIAAVQVWPDGTIQRRFSSLINPRRDIGPSSIHGLTSADVLPAPAFDEIIGQLVGTLKGSIAVAAHNVRFDLLFLQHEFSGMGLKFPECFTMCTMELAGGGRLAECCNSYGVQIEGEAHHALVDATATARLLSQVLAQDSERSRALQDLEPIVWPTVPVTEKEPVTRADSLRRQAEAPSFLQRLARSLPIGGAAAAGAGMAYNALLDRVLEDRHIDEAEGDALVEMAGFWGLSGERAQSLHRHYIDQLAAAALADGVVTESEKRDLLVVARLLGQQDRNWDEILRDPFPKNPDSLTGNGAGLTGLSVCFTGELQCRLAGQGISREIAEGLARDAGLSVAHSVTKKLDLLVLADPQSQSGKAKTARRYGTRILQEAVFWKAIGLDVD